MMRIVAPADGRATDCLLWIAGGLLLAGLAGCSPKPSGDGQASSPPQAEAPTGAPPDRQASACELWYAISAAGNHLGFEHVRRSPATDQEGLWLYESRQQITLLREGDPARQAVRVSSWEEADGRLVRFESRYDSGGEISITRGRVRGAQLLLQTGEPAAETSIRWPAGAVGLSAPLPQFQRLAPGARAQGRYVTFAPVINRLAEVAWRLESSEETLDIDGQSRRARRISLTLTVSGAAGLKLEQTLWLGEDGLPWQLRDQQTGLTWRRTSQERALAPPDAAGFDLNQWVSVPVTGLALSDPRSCREVRYRATLRRGDPLQFFRSSDRQRVVRLDEHTAEITATAARLTAWSDRASGSAATDGAAAAPPGEAELASTTLIPWQAPELRQLAEAAAGSLEDPGEVALALERFVAGHIRHKSYSKAFQSALETARSQEGDCTEHAVLLAALCRARGIPARVVTGLVHHRQAFAYHMWNEVWLAGAWRPLDATLAAGGVTATHLALHASPLAGADALGELLPVMGVMGDLSLEVLEVR